MKPVPGLGNVAAGWLRVCVAGVRGLAGRAASLVKRIGGGDVAILVAILIVVGGALGFIALFDEVSEGDTRSFDLFVMEYVGQHRGPEWLPRFARDLTALGAGSVLALATLASLGFLVLRRQYRAFWFVLIAVTGGYAISSSLKELIARQRPTIFEHGDIVTSFSFPSGHAMMSAVVYLTLGGLLMQMVRERVLKFYIIALACSATFLIGLTRIYVGVHWPTDVLAGWTAGLVWAVFCATLERQLQRRGVVEKDKGMNTS
jgi:undecaprenyl-diphosphatase